MKLITKDIKISKVTNMLLVPFKDRPNIQKQLEKLKGKQVQVEIKVLRKKRSLDSNSYLWVLADKIAKVIGSTKDLVYQRTLLRVGVFEPIAVQEKAVKRFKECWSGKGLGFFCIEQSSKLDDCVRLQCYYGSSTYDSKEMSKLIDEIVSEAKELGIETMSPSELSSLKENWK
jgi:hypothetical protein